MKRRYLIIIVMLAAVMLVSVMMNVYLFNQATRYYTDLNEIRLDPLGLNSYPPDLPGTDNAKMKVLFYGDSRAANWPTPQGDDSIVFLNRGIGAQTTTQVKLRFPYDVPPLKPDVIILQVGINDLKTISLFPERKAAIVADCKENIRQLVTDAHELGSIVILTTIFPVGNVPPERWLFWSDDVKIAVAEVNAYIHALAAEQVLIFDAYSVIVDSNGQMKENYSEDELHINPAGYSVLNDAFLPLLKTVETQLG
jgi:lysophospholipase L1-like esterase